MSSHLVCQSPDLLIQLQIVNEGSVRLNKVRETVLGLNADHLGICKFADRDDDKYDTVFNRLVAELFNLKDEEEETEQKALGEQRLLEWVPQSQTQVPWAAGESAHSDVSQYQGI